MKIESLPGTLPAPWPNSQQRPIRLRANYSGRTIVVLDDDPTGIQTVYDVPVITNWNIDLVRA